MIQLRQLFVMGLLSGAVLGGLCAAEVGPTQTGMETNGRRPTAVRVVSQAVGTDELLLALAEPTQIAALSHLACDENFSAVASAAKVYPRLPANGDAETVLRHRPTLMICANYSRKELVTQVQRLGVKVWMMERYDTLADVYANLRRLAEELGAEAKAERLIATCEARCAALRERLRGVRPVRVIAPSTYGLIPGGATTFQDLCDHAGADNLAATLGGWQGHAAAPGEQMLRWPIEFLVVAGDTVAEALAPYRNLPTYAHLPAWKERRAVLVQPYMLSCVSHHRIAGYERLARGLHPECFGAGETGGAERPAAGAGGQGKATPW